MLTRKQHELLIFIDKHLRATGFSPSFEEMKEALQLRSKSGIHRLISALEERGFLRRRHHRARALEVVRIPNEVVIEAEADMRVSLVAAELPDRSGGVAEHEQRVDRASRQRRRGRGAKSSRPIDVPRVR